MCFHSTSVIGVHGITLPPESDPLLQSTLICYLLGILLILSAENDNKMEVQKSLVCLGTLGMMMPHLGSATDIYD